MRMIKMPCYDEEEFDIFREEILDKFPYGLLNSEYSKKQQIAYFYFWDTDYIPKEWEEYIVRPVSKKSKEEGVSEEHSG